MIQLGKLSEKNGAHLRGTEALPERIFIIDDLVFELSPAGHLVLRTARWG
jgi:hypothetical protein